MTFEHISNKNKKDMDVQACVTPNSVFWLGLADFSCSTFAVKYFCQCLKKTKIKKQASFCALMDHCEFFGVSAFGISAESLYSLVVMLLFLKPQKKLVLSKNINIVVICGMVMHPMVIVLTNSKEKKKILYFDFYTYDCLAGVNYIFF